MSPIDIARKQRIVCPLFKLGLGLIHAASLYTDHMFNDEVSLSILCIDYSNAFNSIRRRFIYDELASTFPELCHYFHFAYAHKSEMYLNNGLQMASCCTGIRQGDPMGPLYFALGVHQILRDLQVKFENTITVLAYLDDINIFGPRETCLNVFSFLRSKSEVRGLRIN